MFLSGVSGQAPVSDGVANDCFEVSHSLTSPARSRSSLQFLGSAASGGRIGSLTLAGPPGAACGISAAIAYAWD